MSLTINILVKNDEETIEETLKSSFDISDSVLIGDIGSNDKTINICKRYGCKIVNVPFRGDFSESKNYMIHLNKEWIMFLEPGEIIVKKPEILNIKNENVPYRIKTIKGDLITKEIRIWHKNSKVHFKNPVFETPISEKIAIDLEIFLTSKKEEVNEEKLQALQDWKNKNPVSLEPLYYLSCVNLLRKEWKNFINAAETYLYMNKIKDVPSIMTRYYLSMVKIYIKEQLDYNEAIRNLIQCIAEKPTMAEFWCLLGDAYYNLGSYPKAKSMYQNAIILGSSRIKNDDLPIEISKYKEYPTKMIESCNTIENNTKSYRSI